MTARKKWFGGRGDGVPIGNAAEDPIGTVRAAPDQTMVAIQWPSRPHPFTWAVSDCNGALGYEDPVRVAHWPVVGSVPCSPAAGFRLKAPRSE